MKLHEYQAKQLFRTYGIPVQRDAVIEHPEEIPGLSLRYPLVLKAQVLVGGRGKAGGIQLARTPEEAVERARAILGMEIRGERVRRVLVAEAVEIEQEHYLAFTVDRSARRLVFVASSMGGVDIEEIARTHPELVHKVVLDPLEGFLPFQARQVARRMGLRGESLVQFAQIAHALYRVCVDLDAELVEINPLARAEGKLVAVDAKVVVDENARFRHPDLPEDEEATELERMARRYDLSYVELSGDIAVIGNGAGLVMSTLDMVAHFGGRPANFLDVGGGASSEAMRHAVDIVLRKPGVRVLFINIFGGITRCDDIARGIVAARPAVPTIIRLVGTNEEEGRRILEEAGMAAFVDPEEAARHAVASARRS
ncbi:MAG: ADP-forming succinate--CoA ligase subunit beta [Armatimonadota bacterium]|nr:ADP-forming succinate--CoA ligase subunit beta [Armatimonadota bacterium]MDR7439920.1 ADP-forming succinate--CoA ligase subunit beta [Armatimonadota bacterium]MDR7562509.1 ADP-forming succinate--CoA ligase subunit beta [Armatimonadota bacterium]MDR7566792.1 ADP-forming succinate--CoA ligase subunit beta [Armatimonadota bacterium]MDR7601393.1 ADP-forming succinate--CoA ligase subunit beta [Armatimonadota bacterium]